MFDDHTKQAREFMYTLQALGWAFVDHPAVLMYGVELPDHCYHVTEMLRKC